MGIHMELQLNMSQGQNQQQRAPQTNTVLLCSGSSRMMQNEIENIINPQIQSQLMQLHSDKQHQPNNILIRMKKIGFILDRSNGRHKSQQSGQNSITLKQNPNILIHDISNQQQKTMQSVSVEAHLSQINFEQCSYNLVQASQISNNSKSPNCKQSSSSISSLSSISVIVEAGLMNNSNENKLKNHSGFDLDSFRIKLHLFKEIKQSSTHTIKLCKNIEQYFEIAMYSDKTNVNLFKMAETKKQLIKSAFVIERKVIVAFAFSIIFQSFAKNVEKLKQIISLCIESHLITANLITLSDPIITDIIKTQKKAYLLNKQYSQIQPLNSKIKKQIDEIFSDHADFNNKYTKLMNDLQQSSSLKTITYHFWQFLSYYIHLHQKQNAFPCLSISPKPYIFKSQKEYLLIVDARIFFPQSVNFKKASPTQLKEILSSIRPHSQHFISEMSKYYDIVCWGDYMPLTMSKILSKIDPNNQIAHVFYQYHLNPNYKAMRGKDLQRIGRDQGKIIVIDTGIGDHPNLLPISTWNQSSSDTQFIELCPVLSSISMGGLNTLNSIKIIKCKQKQNESIGLHHLSCASLSSGYRSIQN